MNYKLLKEFCDINMGQSPDSKTYNEQGYGLPFYQGNADFGKIHPETRIWCSAPVKKAEVGDILITVRAPIGAMNIANEKCCIGRGVAALTPKEECDKKYLYYALESKVKDLMLQGTGSTFKAINKKILEQTHIPQYDINKQRYVANILGKVDLLIDKKQQQIEQISELVKSRFIEMFGDMKLNKRGWKLKSFEELTYLITDGEHATPKRTDKGIYLLSARNILNHSLQLKDVDYINEKEYDRIAKRIIPQEGDILISCSGTVGRCCSVPSGFHFQMVRSVALIRFKEYINPIFAEYMITSDYLQEQINSSKTVSSQANLFQGKIRTLKGFVPPIEMQNEFSVFVHKIDKSKYYNFTSYKYCVLAAKLIRQEWMLCQTLSF